MDVPFVRLRTELDSVSVFVFVEVCQSCQIHLVRNLVGGKPQGYFRCEPLVHAEAAEAEARVAVRGTAGEHTMFGLRPACHLDRIHGRYTTSGLP